jgi:hypothetical protein
VNHSPTNSSIKKIKQLSTCNEKERKFFTN